MRNVFIRDKTVNDTGFIIVFSPYSDSNSLFFYEYEPQRVLSLYRRFVTFQKYNLSAQNTDCDTTWTWTRVQQFPFETP